jgi:hypothetical protein
LDKERLSSASREESKQATQITGKTDFGWQKSANKPAAPNPAMTPVFHIAHHRRSVGEPQCSVMK